MLPATGTPTCSNCGRTASLDAQQLCAPCSQDRQIEAMALAERSRR